MEFKAVNVFLIIALSTCLVQYAFAKPRDEWQTEVTINSEVPEAKQEVTEKSEELTTEVKIPGRISCEFEEATEDTVCQAHCLPKGYTYGICVSFTCSCI